MTETISRRESNKSEKRGLPDLYISRQPYRGRCNSFPCVQRHCVDTALYYIIASMVYYWVYHYDEVIDILILTILLEESLQI